MDIATRVWDHKWKIDPIVRSLIDTDFYKLLMCQSIFRNKPDTQVTFSLINRPDRLSLAGVAALDNGNLILVGQGGVHLAASTGADLGQQQ